MAKQERGVGRERERELERGDGLEATLKPFRGKKEVDTPQMPLRE